MNIRSKTGLEILQIALGVGILADVLLRQTPWGLNVLLFNVAFVTGTVLTLRRRKPEYLTGQTFALLAAQLFFASMFVWRDADELRVADSFAIIAAMSILIVPKLGIAPRVAGVFHYIVGFLWSSFNAAFGSIAMLTMDIDWKTGDRSAITRNAISVLRGLLLVAPLILIFGALFVAADAAYEGLVNRVFNFDIETALSHIFITALFAWATAGYLRAITLGKVPMTTVSTNPEQTGGNTTVRECVCFSARNQVCEANACPGSRHLCPAHYRPRKDHRREHGTEPDSPDCYERSRHPGQASRRESPNH
jgi:hypothetical protein